jgi:hypothetical protein
MITYCLMSLIMTNRPFSTVLLVFKLTPSQSYIVCWYFLLWEKQDPSWHWRMPIFYIMIYTQTYVGYQIGTDPVSKLGADFCPVLKLGCWSPQIGTTVFCLFKPNNQFGFYWSMKTLRKCQWGTPTAQAKIGAKFWNWTGATLGSNNGGGYM